jgi:hypothetical protein
VAGGDPKSEENRPNLRDSRQRLARYVIDGAEDGITHRRLGHDPLGVCGLCEATRATSKFSRKLTGFRLRSRALVPRTSQGCQEAVALPDPGLPLDSSLPTVGAPLSTTPGASPGVASVPSRRRRGPRTTEPSTRGFQAGCETVSRRCTRPGVPVGRIPPVDERVERVQRVVETDPADQHQAGLVSRPAERPPNGGASNDHRCGAVEIPIPAVPSGPPAV